MAIRLSKKEREAIAEAVATFACENPGVPSSIVGCRLHDGRVLIRTGVQAGPRDGIGQVLEATRVGGEWHVKHVGGWRS